MTDAPTPKDAMMAALLESGLQGDYGSLPTLDEADAILSALTAAGYVVAPREPTEAMLDAGSTTLNLDRAVVGEPPAHLMFLSDGAAGCYHAMIAAAPTTKADAP